eukprot:TRINITY_DN8514_c0_g1_i1.p1 TRINITY_DN8514_c0_g1~~TRINITY_DN8514_c0_g1_i1.p1  ORF type:complete len:461 (+),score=38.73 TRINITY_DN8514_c0_g1_i1:62-1444(+)
MLPSFWQLDTPSKQIAWRVLSFIFGCIILLGMGNLYSKGTWVQVLTDKLNYTHTQMNIISSLGDLGMYIFAFPMGKFYDFFGPQLTFILSSLCLFTGYVLMWLTSSELLKTNFIAVGFFLMFSGIGCIAGLSAALPTNVRNFTSQTRGKATGVLVSCFGLSAAIITQLYRLAYSAEEDVSGFMFLLASSLGILPLLGVIFVRLNPPTTKVDIADNEPGSPKVQVVLSRALYGELSGFTLLKNTVFLLLLLMIGMIAACGLFFINNVGAAVKAWKIEALEASTYVIILSLSNCAGRLSYGFLIDKLRSKLPVVALALPVCLLMGTSHFLMAFINNTGILVFGTISTGLSYGGVSSLLPYLTNNYFGDYYFGQNLGWGYLSVGCFSFLIGFISGQVYDHNKTDSLHCEGKNCYMATFLVTTGFCIICSLLTIILARKESQRRKFLPQQYKDGSREEDSLVSH